MGERQGDKLYFSWRSKAHFGHLSGDFMPLIRNQRDKDRISCTHHACGSALEMLYRMKWCKEGLLKENEGVRVKICDIIQRVGSPSKLGNVMSHLRDKGAATNSKEVMRLKEFERFHPSKNREDLYRIWKHLVLKGPFVGLFEVRSDLKPQEDEIYFCCGEQKISAFKTPLQHAVVIVGFGFDQNSNFFWEYQESDNPYHFSYHKDGPDEGYGDGFARIIFTGFKVVYLPEV